MSWEDQGRQDHGWFGHGTGAAAGSPAEGGLDRMFEPGNLAARIAWIAHSAIVHLPRKEWHRQSIAFDQPRLDQLRTVMAAWSGARSLSQDAFETRFTNDATSEAAMRRLRAAADGVNMARTHEDLEQASADLAGGMRGVGLERWPAFLRDVADRVGSQQGGAAKGPAAPQPAQPLPNGYQQQPGDVLLLGRMIFTEAANSQLSYAGIGWAAVNRVRSQAYGSGESLFIKLMHVLLTSFKL